MVDAPQFSVVIPTFNRLEVLKCALRSVFAQSFSNYEIIIVDDGSSDGTAGYIKSLGGQVTALFQQNKGPAAARNFGAKLAKGEYIAFLDSDDCWPLWTLATYRQVIRDYQPSMIFGHALEFHGKAPYFDETPVVAEYFVDYLATAKDPQFVASAALAVRRGDFEDVGGFDERMFVHEDHDLFLRLGTSPRLVRLRSPVTLAYRRHPGNISSGLRELCKGVTGLLTREYNQRYPGGKERRRERSKLLSSAVRPVVLSSLKGGIRREAWCLYRQGFWINLRSGRFRFLGRIPDLWIV